MSFPQELLYKGINGATVLQLDALTIMNLFFLRSDAMLMAVEVIKGDHLQSN